MIINYISRVCMGMGACVCAFSFLIAAMLTSARRPPYNTEHPFSALTPRPRQRALIPEAVPGDQRLLFHIALPFAAHILFDKATRRAYCVLLRFVFSTTDDCRQGEQSPGGTANCGLAARRTPQPIRPWRHGDLHAAGRYIHAPASAYLPSPGNSSCALRPWLLAANIGTPKRGYRTVCGLHSSATATSSPTPKPVVVYG